MAFGIEVPAQPIVESIKGAADAVINVHGSASGGLSQLAQALGVAVPSATVVLPILAAFLIFGLAWKFHRVLVGAFLAWVVVVGFRGAGLLP